MPADEKVVSGSDLNGVRASTWNRFVDTADRVLGAGRADKLGGDLPFKAGESTVSVKNVSGSAMARHAVARVTGILIAPAGDTDPQTNSFRRDPVLEVTTPLKNSPYLVLAEFIGDGKIGQAFAQGAVTVCKVEVHDAAHDGVSPREADTTKLESSAAGVGQILWKESGTGEKWAVVSLESDTQAVIIGQATAAVADTDATFEVDEVELIIGIDPRTDPTDTAETVEIENIFEITLIDDQLVECRQKQDGTWYALAPSDGGSGTVHDFWGPITVEGTASETVLAGTAQLEPDAEDDTLAILDHSVSGNSYISWFTNAASDQLQAQLTAYLWKTFTVGDHSGAFALLDVVADQLDDTVNLHSLPTANNDSNSTNAIEIQTIAASDTIGWRNKPDSPVAFEYLSLGFGDPAIYDSNYAIKGYTRGTFHGAIFANTWADSTNKGGQTLNGPRTVNANKPLALVGSWDYGSGTSGQSGTPDGRVMYLGGSVGGFTDALAPTNMEFYVANSYGETAPDGVEKLHICDHGLFMPVNNLHIGSNRVAPPTNAAKSILMEAGTIATSNPTGAQLVVKSNGTFLCYFEKTSDGTERELGATGSGLTLDIYDDGTNETTDLLEIATTNEPTTNGGSADIASYVGASTKMLFTWNNIVDGWAIATPNPSNDYFIFGDGDDSGNIKKALISTITSGTDIEFDVNNDDATSGYTTTLEEIRTINEPQNPICSVSGNIATFNWNNVATKAITAVSTRDIPNRRVETNSANGMIVFDGVGGVTVDTTIAQGALRVTIDGSGSPQGGSGSGGGGVVIRGGVNTNAHQNPQGEWVIDEVNKNAMVPAKVDGRDTYVAFYCDESTDARFRDTQQYFLPNTKWFKFEGEWLFSIPIDEIYLQTVEPETILVECASYRRFLAVGESVDETSDGLCIVLRCDEMPQRDNEAVITLTAIRKGRLGLRLAEKTEAQVRRNNAFWSQAHG